MLRQNCNACIHGHSVGGTNPSLLEAMVSKNLIIAHDNVFNREVCGDYALYFGDSSKLVDKFELIENHKDEYFKFKNHVYNKVKKEYSWDDVVNRFTLVLDYSLSKK